MQIRRVTVEELASAPNIAQLVEEYARESANPDLGTPEFDLDAYRGFEAAGRMHLLGAFRGNELIGFSVVFSTPVPHWRDKLIGMSESIFVTPSARSGGAGLRLIRGNEGVAHSVGVRDFYMSAPVGSRLAQILPRQGYRLANLHFYKNLGRA